MIKCIQPISRIKQELVQERLISNDEISNVRKKLYNGEIQITQLGEIAEKYRETLKGTVLIAEVCMYF